MLRNEVVELGSGSKTGLADMVMTAAETVLSEDELRARVAATAFDGQYIVMGVGKELRRRLGGTSQWMTCMWDPAHKVELVVDACTKDLNGTDEELYSVAWVGAHATKLQGALTKFQYGKGFEQLKVPAEEMEETMRSPKKFCDTRFVASALRVYKNVLANFPMMVRSYRDASTIPPGAKQRGTRMPRTARNKDEESAFQMLTQLTDHLFVGRLLMLTDIYARIVEVRCLSSVVCVESCVDVCLAVCRYVPVCVKSQWPELA
eukprot:GHVU01154257.1.p2 GENE.GHVU01154257.1~~GHVU01154257.1.p2  ORF type:complete len:262 (+),score=38.09 GHVU01154257.1:2012-2797(+)